MGERLPGPICGSSLGADWIDQGTMNRSRSAPPGPIRLSIAQMGPSEKIEAALRRSLPMMPAEARDQIQAMLSPESLAIIVGTLIVWAGSHFFGIGEIVDIILLVAGFALLGLSAYSGAKELSHFATAAINARTEADLDRAARHFAAAVNIIGISVITALLLRRSARSVAARGAPRVRPMPNVGTPPRPGMPTKISRPFSLPGGALGETDWWGNIAVTRNQVLTEQRLTLYHEWVHRILSPRLSPLRRIRAQLRASAYWRSALMRYIEEALAESYAQLKVHGLQKILVGIRFPLDGGYITVSQLAAEGTAIGNIVIGGARFAVYLEEGK